MDACVAETVCPPISSGWSALVLWTITAYGVLGILSVFGMAVHWQAPSRFGALWLRRAGVAHAAALALAPLLVVGVFGAPRLAVALMLAELALALSCRAVARRAAPAGAPVARLVR